MKKKNTVQTGDIVLVAAAAGAAAAGAVVAVYEVLKSEKGQAGIAKAKNIGIEHHGKDKEENEPRNADLAVLVLENQGCNKG